MRTGEQRLDAIMATLGRDQRQRVVAVNHHLCGTPGSMKTLSRPQYVFPYLSALKHDTRPFRRNTLKFVYVLKVNQVTEIRLPRIFCSPLRTFFHALVIRTKKYSQ